MASKKYLLLTACLVVLFQTISSAQTSTTDWGWNWKDSSKVVPKKVVGVWKSPAQMQLLAFSSAYKKLASAAAKSILSDR